MIYQFRCSPCNKDFDVYRPSKDSHLPEHCPDCKNQMDRVYTIPYMTVKQSDYFHYGLGKNITNTSQVQDELKKYTDRTGKELIELGNEKLTKVAPKSNYEFSETENKKLHGMLEAAGVPD